MTPPNKPEWIELAEADAALAKSPPDFATYQSKTQQARALVQKALTAIK